MRRRRLTTGLIVAGLASSLLAGATPAGASSGEESRFVSLINSERARRDIPELTAKTDLTAAARRHSEEMADRDELFHDENTGNQVDGWSSLGENLGRASDSETAVDEMHRWFMESPEHREKILDRSHNQIGVGAIVRDGTMWVTQLFAARRSAAA
jgi:uncharacterized protein YkwD